VRPIKLLSFVSLVLTTSAAFAQQSQRPSVARFLSNSQIELQQNRQLITASIGSRVGDWTFVGVTPAGPNAPQLAVLEDFSRRDGHIVFLDAHSTIYDLAKSSEPTSADPSTLYLGHTLDEIHKTPTDLLGDAILAKPGDPQYDEVASVFPPLRNFKTYSFVGTPENIDKVGFAYGGRTPNFDPAPYFPAISKIRESGQVLDGLVGSYLPVLRFVYPDSPNSWTEMLAFAPLRISNDNPRIQPVWYRIARIENGELKWAKYIDSYHPFPPRIDYDPALFYRDLAALKSGWDSILQNSMTIDVPDQRLADMARFSLVRAIMTRVGDWPKYGAFDKDYAGSEHDGFPDTFTVETAAMLDWGLVDRAGRYIDNYFGKFVRDDGSILYRGPETGQYGRMLTVVAQFANLGGSTSVLLKRRSRIDGVTKLLLALRARALQLPDTDPAFGMIAGWSEADACLDPDPPRYMQPYFSNSTEAARGFHDLGLVWQRIGQQQHDAALIAWGRRLVQEGADLRSDIDTAISRSILTVNGEKILPSIAGVKEPFHVVVPRDETDPQYRSYRAYMEMMYSGSLTADQAKLIVDYRASHHDILLGMPTAYGYNTGELAGFLSYGYAYGLIQQDMIRRALLLLYSDMAHQYTRGTWTAPETRNVIFDRAAPYCTPAQLVVPLITRWLLVFEDPESNSVWLGKGIPSDWLADGKSIRVSNAPTQWGKLSYSVESRLNAGTIEAQIQFPANFAAETRLRLRVPATRTLKAVTLNGQPYSTFDPASQSITLPPNSPATVTLIAHY